MQKKIVTLAIGAALALAASGAYADQAGPNDVRLGMYFVHYEAEADDISGPYVPAGLNVHVDNVETLYLAYVRSLSTHFDLELAFGYPPLTKTEGRGPATLGSVPYNGAGHLHGPLGRALAARRVRVRRCRAPACGPMSASA